MRRRLMILGVQWVWILLAAGAVLILAAGYLLIAAVRVVQDEPTLFGGSPEPDGLAEPDGLVQQAAAVMQLTGHIPALLVLLAVMLLAGCLALTGALPTTRRVTAAGGVQLAGGSRLRRALLGLATVAGVLALTYAATAGLALTFESPFMDNTPGLRAFLQNNSITALALSLAAVVLLVPVFLSRWVPDLLSTSPVMQDEQGDAAAGPTGRPASETAEADAPQTPPSSSADLIEGRPWRNRAAGSSNQTSHRPS
jgi:hypothetical protein